jgi:hypothetical protein
VSRTVLASYLCGEQWRAEQCPRCSNIVRGTPAAWAVHDLTVHGDSDDVAGHFPLRLVVDDRQLDLFDTETEAEEMTPCDDTSSWLWPPV